MLEQKEIDQILDLCKCGLFHKSEIAKWYSIHRSQIGRYINYEKNGRKVRQKNDTKLIALNTKISLDLFKRFKIKVIQSESKTQKVIESLIKKWVEEI